MIYIQVHLNVGDMGLRHKIQDIKYIQVGLDDNVGDGVETLNLQEELKMSGQEINNLQFCINILGILLQSKSSYGNAHFIKPYRSPVHLCIYPISVRFYETGCIQNR